MGKNSCDNYSDIPEADLEVTVLKRINNWNDASGTMSTVNCF